MWRSRLQMTENLITGLNATHRFLCSLYSHNTGRIFLFPPWPRCRAAKIWNIRRYLVLRVLTEVSTCWLFKNNSKYWLKLYVPECLTRQYPTLKNIHTLLLVPTSFTNPPGSSLQKIMTWYFIRLNHFTAPFKNMRTLKFKGQPTNAVLATINQIFGGSSQLPTMLSEPCSTIYFDYRALCSSGKLGGAPEHLIDGSEKHICRLSFEF